MYTTEYKFRILYTLVYAHPHCSKSFGNKWNFAKNYIGVFYLLPAPRLLPAHPAAAPHSTAQPVAHSTAHPALASSRSSLHRALVACPSAAHAVSLVAWLATWLAAPAANVVSCIRHQFRCNTSQIRHPPWFHAVAGILVYSRYVVAVRDMYDRRRCVAP